MASFAASMIGSDTGDCWISVPAIFLARVFVFRNTGPANAVIVSVVLPEVRATAIALSIFAFHLLGDVPSPILIGRVSDWTGDLGGARPPPSVPIGFSGFFYLWAGRSWAEDPRRGRTPA